MRPMRVWLRERLLKRRGNVLSVLIDPMIPPSSLDTPSLSSTPPQSFPILLSILLQCRIAATLHFYSSGSPREGLHVAALGAEAKGVGFKTFLSRSQSRRRGASSKRSKMEILLPARCPRRPRGAALPTVTKCHAASRVVFVVVKAKAPCIDVVCFDRTCSRLRFAAPQRLHASGDPFFCYSLVQLVPTAMAGPDVRDCSVPSLVHAP